MRKIDPAHLDANFIKLIGTDWMLITAGTINDYNMMTASWGGVGFLWNRPVAFAYIRPQRYTFEFAEREQIMTLSFFTEKYKKIHNICGTKSGRDTDKTAETGLSPFETDLGGVSFAESYLMIEGRKIYTDMLRKDNFVVPDLAAKFYPEDDFHKVYILEIENAWIKE